MKEQNKLEEKLFEEIAKYVLDKDFGCFICRLENYIEERKLEKELKEELIYGYG